MITEPYTFFSEIRKHPERFYVVHYSCQSLYDDNDGFSPRVTSIVVMHLGTRQTVSFSTHAIAEELGISKSDIALKFDTIEAELLSKFFNFVRDRKDKFWLHWNMRNIPYGFEHIEHRYRLLAHSEAPSIPVERRINVSDMFGLKYGDSYVADPKLANLMDLNGGRHRHFLTGPEEVGAFNSCQFIRMHLSTLSKVDFIGAAAVLASKGRLKTNSRGILNRVDSLMESQIARVVTFMSALIGLPAAILQFFGG
jgi:hypothetical protein